jgi:murein DD-endopeptidase MepM/ murein hydrolase activator NlpD
MPSDADISSGDDVFVQAVPPQTSDNRSVRRSFYRGAGSNDHSGVGQFNNSPAAAGHPGNESSRLPGPTGSNQPRPAPVGESHSSQEQARNHWPRQNYFNGSVDPQGHTAAFRSNVIGPALLPPPSDASISSKFRYQFQKLLADQVTPVRLASHLAVLAVAAVILVLSQVQLPSWQLSLRDVPEIVNLADEQTAAERNAQGTAVGLAQFPEHQTGFIESEALQRAVVPFSDLGQSAEVVSEVSQVATAPDVRQEIQSYTVKSGDTVLGIAAKFGLKPETIQWANPALEANPDLLRVGDRLVILPQDGALHIVQPGDTLSSIAAKYKVDMESIASYPLNKLENSNSPLSVGMQLVIPNGIKPYTPRRVVAYSGPVPQGAARGSGAFSWPTSGVITQPFWNGHRALDIGAWTGTPVKASDSGYVIVARTGGWNSGYGNMVMIDHGNGFVSLYAHLNSIYVRQGESVSKGQQIGAVGNTGNSTGPHLHFEIRYQGVPRNPFGYLP